MFQHIRLRARARWGAFFGEGQMDSQDPRIATITDDLRTVYAGMQQLIVPTWLKLDLTMAQFKALVAVERNSGIGVCGLGRELSIGESAGQLARRSTGASRLCGAQDRPDRPQTRASGCHGARSETASRATPRGSASS